MLNILGVVALRKILAIVLAASLLIPLAAGCGGLSTSEPAQTGPLAYELVTGYTGFEFGLFQQVVSRDYSGNVVLSPVSAKMSLAMAYNGASDETAEAMAKALQLEGLSPEEINKQMHDLMASLKSADAKVQIEIANSIWANKDVNFYDDFLGRCKEYYDAEAASVDFEDPETVQIINGWVQEKTHGKIDKIIESLDGDLYALLNAVYFKGEWATRFDESLTENGDFHTLSGDVKKLPMMHQSGDYEYCENEDFQAISLPYGGGRMSMYILLPREGKSYGEFLQGIKADQWEGWIRMFRSREGDIALPRFKVEYEKRLDEALKALGMDPAFIGNAFEKMAPMAPLFISRVLQKTYIDVSEEGTEAAATTYTGIARGIHEEPFAMVVDRPFFFAIRDNQTGTLLFMGSIANP
jgi:serpin B